MKLEDQVVNLNLAIKLKELRVKQDGLFRWYVNKERMECFVEDRRLNYCEEKFPDKYSAFTASEIGEMLDHQINNYQLKIEKLYPDLWKVSYFKFYYDDERFLEVEDANNLANAMGLMLIKLIENKLMEVSCVR